MINNPYGLTDLDIDTLIQIADEFRDNLLKSIGPQGVRQFENNLTQAEEYEFEMLELTRIFNGEPDQKFVHALIQTQYVATSLRSLTELFGEATLLEALPDKAKTKETIDLYRRLSEYGLAGLCQKGMDMNMK